MVVSWLVNAHRQAAPAGEYRRLVAAHVADRIAKATGWSVTHDDVP
jgi:hypothetical protein